MKKILIIDDDPEIIKLIKDFLSKENFEVDAESNGSDALNTIITKSSKYHLILLDLILPDIDGLELCKKIKMLSNIPIIMLTAKDEDVDKIVGLEVGADDYLTKPFNPKELVARIKAVLRRTYPESHIKTNSIKNAKEEAPHPKNNIIKINFRKDIAKTKDSPGLLDKNLSTLKINLDSRRVFVDSKEIKLTNKEYELLVYLINNKGIAVSRERLLENVWGFDFLGGSRTVDVHIKQLRKKIGDSKGSFIETVWSVGYRLNFEKDINRNQQTN